MGDGFLFQVKPTENYSNFYPISKSRSQFEYCEAKSTEYLPSDRFTVRGVSTIFRDKGF